MKKLTTIAIATALSLFSFASYAEYAIGISANFATVDTSGSETLRDSSKISKAEVSEDVVIPEIFIESRQDWGSLGLAYVPTQDIGAKSRSDTKDANGGDGEDTGTYKADAEVSEHFMAYLNLNIAEGAGHTLYAIGGVSMAEISTNESLNSGSSYEDQDVLGYTLGAGVTADIGSNMFYKIEGTYTEYESYEKSSNNNKIVADTEVTSGKISVGYKF